MHHRSRRKTQEAASVATEPTVSGKVTASASFAIFSHADIIGQLFKLSCFLRHLGHRIRRSFLLREAP
jgi:hypothetical protein